MGRSSRCSVNSASQSILSHMGGGTVSATGKMKVGRNANFVLIRTKFVLLVEYEKHRLRPANV